MSPSSGAEPSARLSTSPLRGRCVSSVLAPLSGSYPPPEGRLPMHYSPVCHFTTVLRQLLVRLACVRRAGSVRSEPGSNSRKTETSWNSTQGPPLQYTSIQLSKNEWFSSKRAMLQKHGVPVKCPAGLRAPLKTLDNRNFLDPPT